MIPVLKSDNLVLRGFAWADFPALAEMWADPDLAPFIPFAPLAASDVWARFNANSYSWAQRGIGNFAVVDRAGGFLGTVLFFSRPGSGKNPEYDQELQAGWVFNKAARGRGVGTEAVALAHRWLDTQPGPPVTVCGMALEHIASIRIAEKVGYKVVGVSEDEYGPFQMMKRQITGA